MLKRLVNIVNVLDNMFKIKESRMIVKECQKMKDDPGIFAPQTFIKNVKRSNF